MERPKIIYVAQVARGRCCFLISMSGESQQQQQMHANNWYFTRDELEATGTNSYQLRYKMASFIQALGKQINVYDIYMSLIPLDLMLVLQRLVSLHIVFIVENHLMPLNTR